MKGDEKYWQAQLAFWQSSGDDGASWCRKHNLVYHVFCYWKWKLFPRNKPVSKKHDETFIELSDVEENEGGIDIEYQGIKVHLSRDFDANLFKRLFLVLQDLQC